MNNIILIGMTGSFKTSAGKAVAKLLKLSFYDADEEYEKKYDESIAETFSYLGEEMFREREAIVLSELSAKQDCVIACGGGAVLRKRNIAVLRRCGVIVRLHADPKVLYKRICGDESRPLTSDLTEREFVAMYERRKPLYEKYSDFTVDNTDLTPEQTAEKIIDVIGWFS